MELTACLGFIGTMVAEFLSDTSSALSRHIYATQCLEFKSINFNLSVQLFTLGVRGTIEKTMGDKLAVQDDGRENEMRILFGLDETPARKRSDVDAIKVVGDRVLEFELKSSTTNSFSTVRDLGPDHISKWQTMHWIFAFYTPDASEISEAFYATPAQMQPWVTKIAAYIRPDQVLADMLSKKVDMSVLELIFGDQSSFSVDDAQKIMKRQWTKKEYLAKRDLPDGFTARAMVNILAERVQYLISRGATLNNPHITSAEVRKFSPLAVKKPDSIASLEKFL